MGLFSKETPQTLSEEFVTRYWDLDARVSALEHRIDDALADLKRRAASVAQAERRREAREQTDLDMEQEESPFEKIRRLQRGPA